MFKSKHLPLALTALLVSAGSWLVIASPATAEIVDKVTICHRTNSNANPYVQNEPAADGDVSGHADHVGDDDPGPVWNPTLKADHIKWGDIIPPFDYAGGSFPGLNWTTEGQEIWENGCDTDLPPEPEFGSLTVTKVTTGLPIVGTPVGGALPANFTIHVSCDDGTEEDIIVAVANGTSATTTIDNIEAGSECTVAEQGVAGFPTGTVVTYDPANADTTPFFVDAEETVAVTVTNNFTNVQVEPTTVVVQPPAASPAAVTPQFTG